MPRSRTAPLTYPELTERLGAAVRERYRVEPPAPGGAVMALPRRIHLGWGWACGCVAFTRDDAGEAYLWVACTRHSRRDESVAMSDPRHIGTSGRVG